MFFLLDVRFLGVPSSVPFFISSTFLSTTLTFFDGYAASIDDSHLTSSPIHSVAFLMRPGRESTFHFPPFSNYSSTAMYYHIDDAIFV
jgi:hypothetical protein